MKSETLPVIVSMFKNCLQTGEGYRIELYRVDETWKEKLKIKKMFLKLAREDF